MKLKQYVLVSIMLQYPCIMDASDLATSLALAKSNLSNAQVALASLLGVVTMTQTNPADTSPTTSQNNTSNSDTSANNDVNGSNSSNTSSTNSTGDNLATNNNDNSSGSTTTPPNTTPVNGNPIVEPVSASAISTMITNNSNTSVNLVMLDQNSQQINPTNIALTVGAFSYIPSNVASLKIVDSNNKQLVAAPSITQQTNYSLTNANNAWKIAAVAAPATYNYTNATTIPVIITIITGKNVDSRQLAPGQVYATTIDPSTKVIVNVHANLSGIATSYNPALSYELTIKENQLALTPTSGKDKSFGNRSGWPILITTITSSNVKDDVNLSDGANFKPSDSTTSLMITPLIINDTNDAATVKSCSIVRKDGQLALQF